MFVNHFKLYGLILFIALAFYSNAGQALNLQLYKPHEGFRGGYTLFTTTGLAKNTASFGLSTNYSKNPFQVLEVTPTGQGIVSVIDELVTTDLNGAFGLSENLTLHLALPIHTYYNLPPTFSANRKTGTALGDLRLTGQWRVIGNALPTTKWGLALVPFLTLPTGDQDSYGGDGSITGGTLIALEKLSAQFSLYGNTGVEFRSAKKFLTLHIDHQWLFGLGGQYLFTKKNPISMAVEIFGSANLTKPFDKNDPNPLEAIGILEKSWFTKKKQRFRAHLGAGVGLSIGDYGSPDYRLISGLSAELPMQKLKKTLHTTLYFKTGQSQLTTDEQTKLSDIAEFIETRQIQKIEVKGYADYYGDTYQNNLKLSSERASKLQNSLQNLIDASKQISVDNEVHFELNQSPNLPAPEYRKVEIYFWD